MGVLITLDLGLSDSVFSPFENRYLSQKPVFQWDDLISGRYTENYESYLTDQFVFRNEWMGLKVSLEKVLLKKENNEIVFGKEGYLFNKYISLPDRFFSNVKILNQFIETYENENIFLAIAPNSYAILEDLTPRGLYNVNQAKWLKWLEDEVILQEENFIDIYESLKKHQEDYIYYRLDHHWTTLGAFYAYEAFAKKAGLSPMSLDAFNPEVIEGFYGTFYSAAKRKEGAEDFIFYDPSLDADFYIDGILQPSIYHLKFAEGRDKYGMFLHNNPARASIHTHLETEKKEKRLLIFKDSYANSMIPFLTNHYTHIEIIDLRYYHGSVETLMDEGWDDVLFLFNFISFSNDPHLIKLNY